MSARACSVFACMRMFFGRHLWYSPAVPGCCLLRAPCHKASVTDACVCLKIPKISDKSSSRYRLSWVNGMLKGSEDTRDNIRDGRQSTNEEVER